MLQFYTRAATRSDPADDGIGPSSSHASTRASIFARARFTASESESRGGCVHAWCDAPGTTNAGSHLGANVCEVKLFAIHGSTEPDGNKIRVPPGASPPYLAFVLATARRVCSSLIPKNFAQIQK